MSKNRLIIVDISSFIFRAFYAIRVLHSPQGVPVNAIHGVLAMLLKLLSKYQPTHILLARDTKGGSFRNELYKEYKANRGAPPDDLIPQFALIKTLIEKMEIPDGHMALGSPVKVIKPLDAATQAKLSAAAQHYVHNSMSFTAGLKPLA